MFRKTPVSLFVLVATTVAMLSTSSASAQVKKPPWCTKTNPGYSEQLWKQIQAICRQFNKKPPSKPSVKPNTPKPKPKPIPKAKPPKVDPPKKGCVRTVWYVYRTHPRVRGRRFAKFYGYATTLRAVQRYKNNGWTVEKVISTCLKKGSSPTPQPRTSPPSRLAKHVLWVFSCKKSSAGWRSYRTYKNQAAANNARRSYESRYRSTYKFTVLAQGRRPSGKPCGTQSTQSNWGIWVRSRSGGRSRIYKRVKSEWQAQIQVQQLNNRYGSRYRFWYQPINGV